MREAINNSFKNWADLLGMFLHIGGVGFVGLAQSLGHSLVVRLSAKEREGKKIKIKEWENGM